ncbi:MAG: tetratricopeptide repeat protein [Anaerolineae bacterium]
MFRGGWTLEAAESVGAGDGVADGDVLALLTQLDAKSLVHRRDAGGAPRFHMLETVRQFAAEKCAHDPETESAAIRHMLYFAAMADAERLAQASPSSAAWRSRLASELDNLQRALHVATSSGSLEPAMRLGIVLAKIWELHGTFAPVSALLLPLLDRTPSPGLQSLRTGLQVAVADLILQAGDLDGALHLAQAALDAAVRLGDNRGLADAQQVIAQRALWTGDFESAGDLYEASRRLCLELDDVVGAAAALRGLGQLAIIRGDLVSAAAQFQESLELARSARDPHATASALNGLGATDVARDDHMAARAAFEEALAIFRQLRLPGRVSVTLHNLAIVSASSGDSDGAMAFARESLSLARTLDDKIGVADTLLLLGNMEVAHDDVHAGLAKQVESLAIMRAIGYQRALPVLLLNLSDAEERLDHLDAARGYAQECVALCTEGGIADHLGGALSNLSRIAAREGDEAQARRHFSAAVTALRQKEWVGTLLQVFETRASSPPFASQTSLKLRLGGAAAAMREAIGVRRALRDEARLQLLFDAAGQDLGPAETVRLLEEGRALTREEAVAYALEELSWDDLRGVVAERLATSALAAGASGRSQG